MLWVTAENFFVILIKSSFTAGIAAAVVFAARAAARKAPRRWAYMMWAVVFFRCLCPFSAESGISVFNILHTDTSGAVVYDILSEEYGAPAESLGTEDVPAVVTGDIRNIPKTQKTRYYRDGMDVQPIILDNESFGPAAEPETADSINTSTIFIIVWLCGSSAMAIYGVISACCLAARVKTAVKTEEGVYESDRIATAFTAGILSPRIYIPCGIPENERRLIVMHERVHIRRRDYLFKILAFAGLSLHWFNPLIWAAFGLMTRDMEMSCDEAVMKECGSCDRILYAEALLRVSVKGFGSAAAVGFGETGIKERVKNVLNYKKTSRLAAVLAAALMLASCAAAGTDAVSDNADRTESTDITNSTESGESTESNESSENTESIKNAESMESTDSMELAGNTGGEDVASEYSEIRLEKGTAIESEASGTDTANAESQAAMETLRQNFNEIEALRTEENRLNAEVEERLMKFEKDAAETSADTVLAKPCPQEAQLTAMYGDNFESRNFHAGIDYGVDEGTEVYAAADGKIISCDDKQNGYGTCIIIDHGDGLDTLYAHLSESLVSLEDEVSAGDLIGYSGSTGYAFGNHLHFEVQQDGQHTDPLPYLKN